MARTFELEDRVAHNERLLRRLDGFMPRLEKRQAPPRSFLVPQIHPIARPQYRVAWSTFGRHR